jgi:cysteine desulfuration protein SufE
MLPEEKQRTIVERYLPIEDLHERMALIVARARRLPPLTAEERSDANRVQGCVSRVWIIPTLVDKHCHFRIDADSTLVKGLAALICEIYDGATPAEVVAFETEALAALHLIDHLSPTRRNGLEAVGRFIRNFAETALAQSSAQ